MTNAAAAAVITGPARNAPRSKAFVGSAESDSAAMLSTTMTTSSGQVSQRLTVWIQR